MGDHLIIHNDGNHPTFIQGKSKSYIDLTLTSAAMASKIVNWNVLIGEESLSYHQYIEFSAITQRSQLNTSTQRPITKWKYSANKHDLLKDKMDEAVTTHSKNATAESLEILLQNICRGTLCNNQYKNTKKPVYWWNNDIKFKKNRVYKGQEKTNEIKQKNRNNEIEELIVLCVWNDYMMM